jgi:hypothetical protein
MRTTDATRGVTVVCWLCLLTLLAVLPVVADAATKKAGGGGGDLQQSGGDLFRRAATPQDTALANSVRQRLQQALPFDDGSKAAVGQARTPSPAASAQPGDDRPARPNWWMNVGVNARNGRVRLSGSGLTATQRASVEKVVRGTPGVTSWDWGN